MLPFQKEGYILDVSLPLWKNDLLPKIFKFISIKKLFKLNLVCSTFYDTITQRTRLSEEWNDKNTPKEIMKLFQSFLFFNLSEICNLNEAFETLKGVQKYRIKSLKLFSNNHTDSICLTTFFLRKDLSRLTSLFISLPDNYSTCVCLLSCMHNLETKEELRIKKLGIQFLEYHSLFKKDKKRLISALKDLLCFSCNKETFKVTNLTLKSIFEEDIETFNEFSFFKTIKELRRLKIMNSEINFPLIQNLVHTSIHTIAFENTKFPVPVFKSFVSSITKLKKLVLSNRLIKIKKENHFISKNEKSSEDLYFCFNCPLYFELFQKIKNLEHLKFNGFDLSEKETDKELATLIEFSRKIKPKTMELKNVFFSKEFKVIDIIKFIEFAKEISKSCDYLLIKFCKKYDFIEEKIGERNKFIKYVFKVEGKSLFNSPQKIKITF